MRYLNENINDDTYYINIKEFNTELSSYDIINLLFDEYRLDATRTMDNNIIIVYAFNDNSLKKLEDALICMGASEEYVSNVLANPGKNINENKKYFKNMKNTLNESTLLKRRILETLHAGRKRERLMENRNFKRNLDRRIDFSFINEAEDTKCSCKYNGKLIANMTAAEKREAKEEIRAEIRDLKAEIKERTKAGRAVKALEARLAKLEKTLECLMGRCEKDTKETNINESVSSRMARLRRLFESEDAVVEDEDATVSEKADEESADETEKEETVDAEESKENDEIESNDDEYENVEMKAVVLTVLCKNVDEVKDAMVKAGVAEDDITLPDTEDCEADDKVDVKVDVNSIDALKEYLTGVGIDIEEELGGEIVSDTETAEEPSEDSVEAEDNNDEELPSEEEFDDLFA